ncbi:unnamed protein product [Ectocarpus fasciculatus]
MDLAGQAWCSCGDQSAKAYTRVGHFYRRAPSRNEVCDLCEAHRLLHSKTIGGHVASALVQNGRGSTPTTWLPAQLFNACQVVDWPEKTSRRLGDVSPVLGHYSSKDRYP